MRLCFKFWLLALGGLFWVPMHAAGSMESSLLEISERPLNSASFSPSVTSFISKEEPGLSDLGAFSRPLRIPSRKDPSLEPDPSLELEGQVRQLGKTIMGLFHVLEEMQKTLKGQADYSRQAAVSMVELAANSMDISGLESLAGEQIVFLEKFPSEENYQAIQHICLIMAGYCSDKSAVQGSENRQSFRDAARGWLEQVDSKKLPEKLKLQYDGISSKLQPGLRVSDFRGDLDYSPF